MTRWAACGGTRTLPDLVDEAFQVLATGLADPIRPAAPTSAAPTSKDSR
jgi:hypothetical protein